jgi:DNA-binding SARP family transcriptional activator
VLTDRYDYGGAQQALAHAKVGFTRQKDAGSEILLAWVHNQQALLRLFEGRHEDAIAEARAALKVLDQQVEGAQAEEQRLGKAEAQRLIGRTFIGLGRFVEGIVQLQKALALYRQAGSPYDVVNLLHDLFYTLTTQGRFDEAGECLNEALIVGRQLGAPTQLAGTLNNLGWIHYARGDYREALALYEEGLAAARRAGASRYQVYISVGMADLYRDVGAYERAWPLYETGWRMARESEPALAVYALIAQADMRRWQGDHARALALLDQARRLTEGKELDFEARGLLPVAEGIALAESGEIEAGLCLISAAARFLERQQSGHDLARARFLKARVHLLSGDEPRAVAELRRALDLAGEIGAAQFAVAEGRRAGRLLELGAARGIATCGDVLERARRLAVLGKELGRGDGEKDVAERLEIYALGGGRVVRDGRPIPTTEWRAAMARELFFYILLHGPVGREAIFQVFWPEFVGQGTGNFRTTLYRVRRTVGAGAVVWEGEKYRLGDVDYWFDVEEFEALVERARRLPAHDWRAERLWQRAAALYRGDLLPEVERTWCAPRREALREMCIEARTGAGGRCEARGEFEEAVEWYGQALELDALREDVHRRVMHCYARAGRRSMALAQYRHCRETLGRELGVAPSAETNRLYEQILEERDELS